MQSINLSTRLKRSNLLHYFVGVWQSDQMHLTVNQVPKGYSGLNPLTPTSGISLDSQ